MALGLGKQPAGVLLSSPCAHYGTSTRLLVHVLSAAGGNRGAGARALVLAGVMAHLEINSKPHHLPSPGRGRAAHSFCLFGLGCTTQGATAVLSPGGSGGSKAPGPEVHAPSAVSTATRDVDDAADLLQPRLSGPQIQCF